MMRTRFGMACWVIAVVAALATESAGQSNSLFKQLPLPSTEVSTAGVVVSSGSTGAVRATSSGQDPFASAAPRRDARPATLALERVSMFTTPPTPPRKFKLHDLVTVIVRQHKKYEGEAEYEKEKKWDLQGKLSEWFRFHDDVKHLGSDKLTNGEPGVKFKLKDKYETEGDVGREDKFTTRIQATIIDVKPNGNLVLEANMDEAHDEEKTEVTLTGECRAEDVTPANTIMSTQIAGLSLIEKNKGAVRDAVQRGWIPRILDFAKPF